MPKSISFQGKQTLPSCIRLHTLLIAHDHHFIILYRPRRKRFCFRSSAHLSNSNCPAHPIHWLVISIRAWSYHRWHDHLSSNLMISTNPLPKCISSAKNKSPLPKCISFQRKADTASCIYRLHTLADDHRFTIYQ